MQLNVSVPGHLAELSKRHGFILIYISTGVSAVVRVRIAALINFGFIDYVFDGNSAPYVPSAQTNPLNLYGRTKRDGELAVLGVEGARTIVLRVPVL